MAEETSGTDTSTLSHAQQSVQSLLSQETQQTKPTAPADTAPAEQDEEAQAADPVDDEEQEHVPDAAAVEGDDVEDSEPVPPKPRMLRAKIDGEEVEVTEEEAVKGYQRTADYTKKTQAIAAEKQAFQAEQVAVRAEREKLAASLAQLTDVLEQGAVEPDWEQLRQHDPASFAAEWASWDQQSKQIARVKQARDAAAAKVEADRAEQYTSHLSSERTKLIEAIPAWSDAAVQEREKAEMKTYALARGFTEAELGQVSDHRTMLLLRDAMLQSKAVAAKPLVTKKIEAVRMATPGAANEARQPMSEKTKSYLKLAKSGKLDDAADAIKSLI